MWGKRYLETNTYCSFVCVSFCLLLLSTNIRDKLKEQYWQVFLLSSPQLLIKESSHIYSFNFYHYSTNCYEL